MWYYQLLHLYADGFTIATIARYSKVKIDGFEYL